MTQRTPQIGEQQRMQVPANAPGELFSHKGTKEGQLFRVAADGVGFLFDLEWGTSTTRRLQNILGPLSADFPGSCSIVPRNTTDVPAFAVVTAAHAVARGPCLIREFIDATVNPGAAQPGAARIINPGGAAVTYALPDGTTVTIANVPESIGRPFPITSGSVISAGKCFVEYEI